MKTKFIRLLTNDVNAMENIIALTISSIVFVSCNTTNQTHLQKTISHKLNDSLLLDRDSNAYPVKKMPDNNLWMTANLKLNIADSYCYENIKENCEKYGRVYTWESAQKGCSLLGEGWRLPTDDEWRRLSILYGGIAEDSNVNRNEAFKTLLNTGTSGFNAVLGGGRAPDGQYARLDAHGFYWTATESNDSTAWFANFAKGSQALYLQNDGEKPGAFSVRCVKRTNGDNK